MAAAYKRAAAHAGSWYTDDPAALARSFEKWLAEAAADESVAVGAPAAGRLAGVVCPHAGYRYSGATASHSYMHVRAALRSAPGIRRIFVLGPSHKVSLEGIAISGASLCSTPCGDLAVDQETAAGLLSVLPGKIARRMTQREDENEHSIEMQLPFLAHLMAGARGAAWQSSATIVPIMVGRIGGSAAGGSKVADVLAAALAPFLADASNLFVISSDFCHWGDRFDFQPYASVRDRERLAPEMRGTGSSACPDIGDCIEHLDRTGMELIEAKDASKFDRYCSETGNTICGRNPISLFLRTVSAAGLAAATNVRFLHYAQSSHVTDPDDSSVSYAAAAAVIAAGASDEPHTRATAEAGAAGSGAPREL